MRGCPHPYPENLQIQGNMYASYALWLTIQIPHLPCIHMQQAVFNADLRQLSAAWPPVGGMLHLIVKECQDSCRGASSNTYLPCTDMLQVFACSSYNLTPVAG
jgi:hypothetical protein